MTWEIIDLLSVDYNNFSLQITISFQKCGFSWISAGFYVFPSQLFLVISVF